MSHMMIFLMMFFASSAFSLSLTVDDQAGIDMSACKLYTLTSHARL